MPPGSPAHNRVGHFWDATSALAELTVAFSVSHSIHGLHPAPKSQPISGAFFSGPIRRKRRGAKLSKMDTTLYV